MVRKSNIFNTTALSHRPVYDHLISICKNLMPDIILLGHVFIPPDVLKKMASFNKSKIIAWFVDTLNEEERLDALYAMGNAVDFIFATTGGEYLQKLSQKCETSYCSYIPNVALQSIEYARNVWEQYDHDFIFCGSDNKRPGRASFIEDIVQNCPDVKIKLAGCLGYPAIKGNEYITAVRGSLMGLNFSKYNDIYLYSSDRISQLSGQGCLVLTPKIPGMSELYPENSVCYFDNEKELFYLINYYAKNPGKAIEIAKRGYQITHDLYSAQRVTEQMFNLALYQRKTETWADEAYLAGVKIGHATL
jgi:hypothetical protein